MGEKGDKDTHPQTKTYIYFLNSYTIFKSLIIFYFTIVQ